MKSRLAACWAAMVLGVVLPVVCAPQAAVFSADSVKAAFLYRFASYVEWPADVAPGPLVIGVVGVGQIANQLDELLPRMTVNGRPAQVRRIGKAGDLDGVHILYVAPQAMKRSRGWRNSLGTRPVLVVTDLDGGLDSGSIINFVEANRNVRFEISLIAADRAHLKITSALLSVAARVERRPQAWTRCAEPYPPPHGPAACQVRVAAAHAGVVR